MVNDIYDAFLLSSLLYLRKKDYTHSLHNLKPPIFKATARTLNTH